MTVNAGTLLLDGTFNITNIFFGGGSLESSGIILVGQVEGVAPEFKIASGSMGVVDINIDGSIVNEPGATLTLGTLKAGMGKTVQLNGEIKVPSLEGEGGIVEVRGDLDIKTLTGELLEFHAISGEIKFGDANTAGIYRIDPVAIVTAKTLRAPTSVIPPGEPMVTTIRGNLSAETLSLEGGIIVQEGGELSYGRLTGGSPASHVVPGVTPNGLPPTTIRNANLDGANQIEFYLGVAPDGNPNGYAAVQMDGVAGAAARVRPPIVRPPATVFPALELVAPAYTIDRVWDLELELEADIPPVDLFFNIPTNLLFPAGIPAIAPSFFVYNLHNENSLNIYPGILVSDQALTNGAWVNDNDFLKIKAEGVDTFSPFTIVGCESCEDGKTLICQTVDGSQNTVCIDPSTAAGLLANGSFCGPCEQEELPVMPRGFAWAFSLLLLSIAGWLVLKLK